MTGDPSPSWPVPARLLREPESNVGLLYLSSTDEDPSSSCRTAPRRPVRGSCRVPCAPCGRFRFLRVRSRSRREPVVSGPPWTTFTPRSWREPQIQTVRLTYPTPGLGPPVEDVFRPVRSSTSHRMTLEGSHWFLRDPRLVEEGSPRRRPLWSVCPSLLSHGASGGRSKVSGSGPCRVRTS